jgi:DNA polymerase (family 10)
MPDDPSNRRIADALDEAAAALEGREENPFRVQAYRDAARSVALAGRPVAEMLREGGVEALRQLPRVGPGLAAAIEGFVRTGRLRGAPEPDALLAGVPGLGPTLARRVREELGIATLEDLEAAAHDGRLEHVEGFGRRRLRTLRETLNSMLSRSARRRASGPRPPAATLLAIDADYREQAGRGALRKIAPRRFNPEGRAWLPILRERRDGWNLTALFSNTAQAHRLGRTSDWVVVFFEQPGRRGQSTVVTETRGPLAGCRVIRGREAECAALHGVELPGRRSG